VTEAALFLFIILPWLSPFTLGPTASVAPLLVSWACAAALSLTRAPIQDGTAILKRFGAVALLFLGAALCQTGFPPGAETLALVHEPAGHSGLLHSFLRLRSG
jgi:hypothetical protein